jgi:hypothetical protein
MTATTNDAIIFWPLPFTDTVPSDYRSLQPLISSTQRRVFLVIDSPWLQNQLRDKEVQGGHHRQQQRQEEEDKGTKKDKETEGKMEREWIWVETFLMRFYTWSGKLLGRRISMDGGDGGGLRMKRLGRELVGSEGRLDGHRDRVDCTDRTSGNSDGNGIRNLSEGGDNGISDRCGDGNNGIRYLPEGGNNGISDPCEDGNNGIRNLPEGGNNGISDPCEDGNNSQERTVLNPFLPDITVLWLGVHGCQWSTISSQLAGTVDVVFLPQTGMTIIMFTHCIPNYHYILSLYLIIVSNHGITSTLLVPNWYFCERHSYVYYYWISSGVHSRIVRNRRIGQ